MSRTFSITLAVTVLALGGGIRNSSACGDKFLLLGRAVGYDQILKASQPGTVLIYSSATLPSAFRDGRFSALMELAGHRQRSVSDRQALERAISTGKIDLVIADPVHSREIDGFVQGSSSALVIPVVTVEAAADRSELERKFGCVLKLPAEARKVIDALDKAMKLKAKRSALRTV